MGLASACINNADQDGIPSRANGRGGLGAVMGSKGVKAIVLEPVDRSAKNTPKQPMEYREALKQFSKLVLEHPATRGFRGLRHGEVDRFHQCARLFALL